MRVELAGVRQLLDTSDFYLERSLSGLDRDALCARIRPANSPLWIAGHVALGRARLAAFLGSEAPLPWVDVFGKGSCETDDVQLPPLDAVLARWRSTGAEVRSRLGELTAAELARPAATGLPGSDGTLLGTIHYLVFHEAYHVGQIAHVRKTTGRGLPRRTADRLARRRAADRPLDG